MLWAIAILTMVVGTVTAVTQTDVKRMLAYSAVAHTGFILTGVIADNAAGLSSTLFYLFAYGFSTVGAFAVVEPGPRRRRRGRPDLASWAGSAGAIPIVGMVFSLFLLAFAGIPLTSGFVSKFAVFKAAGEGGAMPLVDRRRDRQRVAAYFYVRVIVLMFFTEPQPDGPTVAVPSPDQGRDRGRRAVTVVLGIAPQPLLDLANQAGVFRPLVSSPQPQGTQRPEPRPGADTTTVPAPPADNPHPAPSRSQGPRPWTRPGRDTIPEPHSGD